LRLAAVARTQPGVDFASAVARVAPGEPVIADNYALAHLTHRRQAWLFPSPFGEFDPPELGPEVDPEAGAAIEVAVVQAADAEAARAFGFTEGEAEAGVYVLRRS
jgi:hypothetical protein